MIVQQLQKGAVANLPVAASVVAYGSVLGMLAAQKGLTWVQLLAMNLSVFAGSAQFVMVEMWAPPLPVVEMVLAVLIINMRYLLIGASLHPLFKGKSLAHKAGIMHLVADENWAVGVRNALGYDPKLLEHLSVESISRYRLSVESWGVVVMTSPFDQGLYGLPLLSIELPP